MRVLQPLRFLFVLMLWLSALHGAAAAAEDPAARGPHAELDPPQVAQAMLAALKKNTDQGIAELYRPDMLGHREARVGPPLIDGDRAMLPVELIGSDAQTHRYIFLMSRQEGGECTGCWMADAVVNSDDEEPGEPEKREYGA
jgi:hypothetical protein